MVLTLAEQALNERIITEGLHNKFDGQLVAMEASHSAKLPHVESNLDKVLNYPGAVKWELKEAGLPQSEIQAELKAQQDYYQWKKDRLDDIVFLLANERAFRRDGKVSRSPIGTTYYIDSDNGLDANDGLGTGTAWRYLDKFTEAARSAGDKAILRRGMTNRYDDGTDLLFTSDGSVDNPIIIEADYDDAWSGQVDLSATATATLTFGSKTITFASDISGVLAAGDWIYASGDNNREFAYEVASVATVTATLFLPYKGDQAGSGKTMFSMQSAPIWNTAAGDFQLRFDADNYWKVQGIHIRGTDFNGNVDIDSCAGHVFRDVIFEGNDTGDQGIRVGDDRAVYELYKCRFITHGSHLTSNAGLGAAKAIVRDCLIGVGTTSAGIKVNTWDDYTVIETEMAVNTNDFDVGSTLPERGGRVRARNVLVDTTVVDQHDASAFSEFLFEDYDAVLNDTRQLTGLSTAEGTPIMQSEETIVRGGGGTRSIKVTPSTKLSTKWELSRILLFEFPIYAAASSKTYTVYLRPSATADWTADPTAAELWIELEAWGHATNNFRRITKSTGVIDMNGSTAWQTLTVTVAPAQVGVAYLRCYYAKTKESAKSNVFYCDPKVGIS